MEQLNRKWNKILRLLFEYPTQSFTIREIAIKTKMPTTSVQRYIMQIKEKKLIDQKNRLIPSAYTKFIKTFFIIEQLHLSGLLDYLEKIYAPSAIILFGSIRKGEYEKESDIDIFIETSKEKKESDLKEFEKKLGHPIQLFIHKDIKELPNNLFNNVINGIKLQGYFTVK